ncbi:MAG TPA: VWA domain-containing protein [Terracidiphilus sp.]
MTKFGGRRNFPKRVYVRFLATLPAILSTAFLAATLHPQDTPSPAQSQSSHPDAASQPAAPDTTPTLTTNVNEVSLDLVIHDRDRRPVRNLQPEDLVVLDDGKPVKLTGLHLVTQDPAANGHMVTLVFDSFHGPIAKSARIAADRVLAALPAQGFSLAVMNFGSRLRLIQGFTQDRNQVDRAVQLLTDSDAMVLSSTRSQDVNIVNDKADAPRDRAVSAAEKDLIAIAQTGIDVSGHRVDFTTRARAQSLLTALQDTPRIVQEKQSWLNLAGLLALARSQQRMTERRAIIYFTENRMMDPATERMLQTVTDGATAAGVSIYIVDMDSSTHTRTSDGPNARFNGTGQVAGNPKQQYSEPIHGVAPPPPPAPTGPRAPSPQPSSQDAPVWTWRQDVAVMTDFMRSSGEDQTDPFADNRNLLSRAAKASGGLYIDTLTNIRKPLEQMTEDLTTYYQATYTPPFKDYDGKFRKIDVNSVHAGVSIKTRTGYYALPPNVDSTVQPFELPLLKVFAEPELPSALKFKAGILRFGDLPDGNASAVAVEVPLSELQVSVDAQTNVPGAHLSVVAQIRDESGVVIDHFGEDLQRRGVADAIAHNPLAAASVSHHFISTPGKYTLEAVVRDQNSGHDAAQRIPFEIAPSASPLALSDMVLVRGMEPHFAQQEDALEPMRYEHQKVVPNLAGLVTSNAKNAQIFFILHPDPASSDALTLQMQLTRNGKSEPPVSLLQTDGAHSAIPYLASVSSGRLAAGDYEVKAILSQGAETATQIQTFHVEGAPGTAESDAKTTDDDTFATLSAVGDEEIPFGDAKAAGAAPVPPGQLHIESAAGQPLSSVEAASLIEKTREHALDYHQVLPDFTCTEITRRSIDRTGNGRWRLSDTLVETLNYSGHVEQRTLTEINGRTATTADRSSIKGAVTSGEFGGVLHAVFRADAHAVFGWKQTGSLNANPVQIFDYKVERERSAFTVTGKNGVEVTVGFHGQVYVDATTGRARRVTLMADNLPSTSTTQSTSITVDYDYVPINGLLYLMPISAELQLRQGQHQALINTMQFTEYKRSSN